MNPDSRITGLDAVTDMNAWLQVVAVRAPEQPAHVRDRAVESRLSLVDSGLIAESYGRIRADLAFGIHMR